MRLTFQRSGHVYLNAGIVVLHEYLLRFPKAPVSLTKQTRERLANCQLDDFSLSGDALVIDTSTPIALLEALYYWMGEEVYNNSTENARKTLDNAYYIEAEDRFERFPKMKSYGFAAMLTNDAAGKTPREENTLRQKAIKPNDERGNRILKRFEAHYEANNLKLGQQLYVNEPYAKISRLKLTEQDLLPGNKRCPLTGEGFKRLQSATATSPTASGLSQFLSGVGAKTDKIGWKALYLMRFAPKLSLYRYAGGLDILYCYFYDAPTLLQLERTYEQWNELYYDSDVKRRVRNLANFKLEPIRPKGITKEVGAKDFVHPNEILFQLMYTIYRKQLDRVGDKTTGQKDGKVANVDFYLLRAEKFAGTMRPTEYTVFNQFTYVQRYLEVAYRQHGVDWTKVLRTLVLSKPGNGKNDFHLSRRLRDEVLRKIMHGQSIAEEVATLLYDCYSLRISGDPIYYKSFEQLERLIDFNEFNSLNPHAMLDKTVRERAYNLGVQIGENIMRTGEKNDKMMDRAKAGRTHVVRLNKARTYEDFLEAIVRIMTRFNGVVPSRDLFEKELTEDNLKSVKLLTVIGAMTRINSRLNREDAADKSKKEKTA